MDIEPYMTAKELAAYLKINVQTVYRKIKKKGGNRLPHVRVGHAVRFNKNMINEWMKEKSTRGRM